ncbi:type II secretion system protein, partial [Bacillus sp. SIMBA_031]|uniref:type II secretion system protein n=1 Tax=Bacillus sp. SIMBA_031 TaxID=3085774 RepID=UPI0039798E1F
MWSERSNHMCPSLRQPVGFTLLELLVSLAILAILAMLVLPITQLEVQRMREKDLRLALREIRIGIDAYK